MITVFILFCSVPLVLDAARVTENRIVGGFPTLIHAHPYQLTFLFQKNFICGAVLITKDAALTAAHCVRLTSPDPADFSVRAGSSFSWFGGIEMDVDKVIPHPKFATFDYDIAVIKLVEALPLSSRIQPISISKVGGESLAGKMVKVSGWGVTIPFIPQSTSLILQETTLSIVKKSVCKQTTGYEFLTDRMICAKGVGPFSDSCQITP
ncbi:trypsin 3A1 isoform X2 [Agrilus planipennis]|uniref:Trypsin 3A1 isoform X2 n=1 Tax=Agrilus planipennis TaxID=224129 RepID=A0A7F5R577_AGRPL|nr:trypsin 3A1 isoform X2 [Agrilus planipennis]